MDTQKQSQALVVNKKNELETYKSNDQIIFTIEALKSRAEIYLQSGLLPKEVKTWQTAVVLMDMAQALGIKIQFASKFFNIIYNQPTLSPKGMLAVIYNSGLLTKNEYTDDGNCAFVTLGRRQTDGTSLEFTGTFRMEDALKMMTSEYINGEKKSIPLSSKSNWKSMPRVMRKWRALSEAANWLFSDIIGGMLTPEEIENSIDITDNDLEIEHQQTTSKQVTQPANTPKTQRVFDTKAESNSKVIDVDYEKDSDPVIEQEEDEETNKKLASNCRKLITAIQAHGGTTSFSTVNLDLLKHASLVSAQNNLLVEASKALSLFLENLWREEIKLGQSIDEQERRKHFESMETPSKSLPTLKLLISSSQNRLEGLSKQEKEDEGVADF